MKRIVLQSIITHVCLFVIYYINVSIDYGCDWLLLGTEHITVTARWRSFYCSW